MREGGREGRGGGRWNSEMRVTGSGRKGRGRRERERAGGYRR